MKLHTVVLPVTGVLLAAIGLRLGYSRLVAPLEHGRLEIPPERLNFGTALVQDDFVYRLPVENRSAYPVEIASFERSCGCTIVTPNAFTLAPSETRWLQLNLDLHGADGFEFSGEERDFAVDLRPVYAKAMTPGETWRVIGRIQSPFNVSPRHPRFATEALVAGSDFRPLEFSIEPRQKGQELRVSPTSRSAPARVECAHIGDATQVTLVPEPLLPVGDHVFRLSVEWINRESTPLPPFELRVVGRVVPDVQLEPSHVRLDLSADGATPETRTIRLKSRTGTPFKVIGVGNPEEVIEVEPTTANGAAAIEHEFRVRGVSATRGLVVQLVQFKIRSTSERVGEFEAPLQVVLRTQ
ncbi:MAG: hypothetical protein SGJ19_10985 [Planctomycetia bacterium]|nr:hypothetical protein [Planctomycetia bacterium]